jgi:hypothetical protein
LFFFFFFLFLPAERLAVLAGLMAVEAAHA